MRSFLLHVIITISILARCSSAAAQGTQTVVNGNATTAVSFPANGCVYNLVNSAPGIGLPASGSGDIASFTAINTGSAPVTATITATPSAVGYAYVGNYGASSISVINTATNTVITTIPLPAQPGAISASPDGSRIYTANENANSVSVIDTKTNTVTVTIPVGTDPSAIAISSDGSQVYVANVVDNTLSIISASSNTVTGTISGFDQPYFVAANPVNGFLYVANSPPGTISVVNPSTKAIIKTITVGADPIQVLVSPDGSKVYVTNQLDNTISVIDATTNSVSATVTAGVKPYGEAISPDGNFLYVGCSAQGIVIVIDTKTNGIVKSIRVGNTPIGISVTADGGEVYVTDDESPGSASVISTATSSVIATVPVGNYPFSLGNFTIPGTPCNGTTVTFIITVNPTAGSIPTIVAGAASGSIYNCAGDASSAPQLQQFTVYGDALAADLLVTAPQNFEVSLSPSTGYQNSITLTPAAGNVNSTIIYVRSAGTAPPGRLTGEVELTSAGAPTQEVAVAATINTLPVVAPVTSQRVPGGTPTAAIAFTGTGNTYNWVNDTPGIGLAASGTGDIASFTTVNKGTSPITATITVTPVLSARAYVANYYGDNVSVIDDATSKVIATVPTGGYPSGVSVSADGTKAYVTNAADNTVSVINTATNTVVATMPTGEVPSGIAVTPDGSRLYVSSAVSGSVTAINVGSGTIAATIKVGQRPFGIAISPDGKYVYVANFMSNTVSVIPTSGTGVSVTIPVGKQPLGIAVSPDGSHVYVVNQGDGSVSVISTYSDAVVTTFSEGIVATGIAVSPDGSLLYVSNTGAASVSVINAANNTKITSVDVGQNPYGVSLNGDGSRLYAVNNVSNSVSVINTATDTVSATIPVDRDPYSLGNFVSTGAGCSGAPVKFTITVDPEVPAGISVSGSPSPLNTIYGTPSSSATFTVSGVKMTAGITITAPAGFELSTNGTTFKTSVIIGAVGTIAVGKVYIRLAATTPVGSYSGNIVLSSTGVTSVDVFMPLSTVSPAPLIITADDKSKVYNNPNPILTASYAGLVNGEPAASLTILPVLTTTAVTSSPAGQYPITVSGAVDANYVITYVGGILTIVPAPQSIVIPNTFTPNGDGVNDTWNIQSLSTYLNCSVDIFSRYGQKVFSSIGYGIPWDGTFKGSLLPTGTYYYLINLRNGVDPLSGFVTIVR